MLPKTSWWMAPDWWVDFDAPQYLFLLALLPLFWLIARRSLGSLGAWRRNAALSLRVMIGALLVISLAEPNWLTLIRRLTVIFVVDASDSIQRDELDHALAYVNAAAEQRDVTRGDRAGVVVFGRDAALEVPPINQPWHLAQIESEYDPRFTNLEEAMQQAAVAFPADSAKRVVIVSDGNENLGQANPQVARMLEAGIGIDVVPISYERRGDVIVEKVAVPSDIRHRTPFGLRVVLNNLARRQVKGLLRITRTLGGVQQLVAEEPIVLEPGKRVLTLRQELVESGMSTYEARFLPDNPADDVHSENNSASGFVHVSGKGHVLVIEDASQAGRFSDFVDLLRRNEIEVTVRDTRRPFDNLADLQQFDAVVLADVARVSGDGTDDLTQFTDEQIRELVQNTQHFGAGLVVLGGPNSYGAGGWNNTELEKALPVEFQIDNAKVEAVGALMLVIDSSGSMSGSKIVWSKAAAIAATQLLSKRDHIGVVTFDTAPHWIVPMQRNGNPLRARARIDRIGAGGGTDMMPALKQAYNAIGRTDASLKHVIVLTDGQTPQDDFSSLVTTMRARGITTTGVAIGPDADRMLLADIGRRGGGKYYHVMSPNVIPRIFMREARRVAMPLIFEDRNGIPIQMATAGELLSGLDAPPPPITGYVLTTLKRDPLVEVLFSTPRQVQPNSTILASWQFGLGRATALTTDVGQRWASDWNAWSNYEKFMLQIMRWSMRSHDVNKELAMSVETRDGAIDMVVNALDHEKVHLNSLNLIGTAIKPNGEAQTVSLEQVAPGRYTAKVPIDEPGNYYLSVSGGRGAPLRSAVSVSPSAELDDLFSYEGFLMELAEGTPKGGEAGRTIQSPRGIADTQSLLRTDVFRSGLAPAKSREPMWPVLLLVASIAFFGDVFCRRVVVSFSWLSLLAQRLRWADAATNDRVAGPPMERLRQSKTEAMARFSSLPSIDGGERLSPIDELLEPGRKASKIEAASASSAPSAPSAEEPAELSEFTARLLEVKKRVRGDQRPK